MDVIFKFLTSSIFMYPLILCSIISATLIVERGLSLRRKLVIPPDLYDAIFQFRIGNHPQTLAEAAGNGETPLSRLTRTCLEHLPFGKAENVEAMQTHARTEITKMERGLVILEIITGIGPMLGLLGTVGGLITIFSGGEDGNFVGNVPLLAQGIAEALNTTVFGLAVAIPSLIAFTYYSKKVENMAIEMEGLCADMLTKLYLQVGEEPTEEPPPLSPPPATS